jgi:hypothetical protein
VRETSGIPLGCSLILPVGTANRVQTLKASTLSEGLNQDIVTALEQIVDLVCYHAPSASSGRYNQYEIVTDEIVLNVQKTTYGSLTGVGAFMALPPTGIGSLGAAYTLPASIRWDQVASLLGAGETAAPTPAPIVIQAPPTPAPPPQAAECDNANKECVFYESTSFDGVRCAFFDKEFTLGDVIGSHTCSLQASRRVTNGIPLACPLFLPVHTVNCV